MPDSDATWNLTVWSLMPSRLAMALFGQNILVSKAVGVVAIAASLLVAYRVFAEPAGRFAAVVATASAFGFSASALLKGSARTGPS